MSELDKIVDEERLMVAKAMFAASRAFESTLEKAGVDSSLYGLALEARAFSSGWEDVLYTLSFDDFGYSGGWKIRELKKDE